MSFATLARNTRYAFGENRLTLIAVAMLALHGSLRRAGSDACALRSAYDQRSSQTDATERSALVWHGRARTRHLQPRHRGGEAGPRHGDFRRRALLRCRPRAWRRCRIFRRLDGRGHWPCHGYHHGLPSVRSGHGHRRRARQQRAQHHHRDDDHQSSILLPFRARRK